MGTKGGYGNQEMTDMTGWDLMIEDGVPEFLLMTAEERRANWIANPPTTKHTFSDPKFEMSRALAEEQKRVQAAKRINRIRATIDPETKKKYDLTGKRWNMRMCRWEKETP